VRNRTQDLWNLSSIAGFPHHHPSSPIIIIRRSAVDENRIEGTIRNTAGKVQEGVGKVTGNAQTRSEGIANQAIGAAQDFYGQTADAGRKTASTLDRWLRTNIETQPYTSALIALGIGWLLGRMHRPL
jgi:uncharacterized protein YjbJ (UPF0337 family)